MYVIGLTGGIATGKSTASATMKEYIPHIWDADLAARLVVEQGEPGSDAIRLAFGDQFFDKGKLDRRLLAEHVFGNEELLVKLNRTLHPIILNHMSLTLQKWDAEGVKLAVVDAPLLFESGASPVCDEIWTMSCGEDEQIRRVIARDSISPEEAEARVASQLTDGERRRRSSRVIDSSGDEKETQKFIRILCEELLEENG